MICQKCAGETGTAKFCPDCGAPCVEIVSCERCGTLFGSKYCPECGTERAAQTQALEPCPAPVLVLPGGAEIVTAEPAQLMRAPAQTMQPRPVARQLANPAAAPKPSDFFSQPAPTAPEPPPFQAAQPPVAAQAAAAPAPTVVINNVVNNTSTSASNSENSNTNANPVTVHYAPHTANTGGAPAFIQPYPPVTPQTVAVMQQVSTRNRAVALLLALFLGVLGVHRFYAGKIGTGLLYFFTGGLFGIGYLVDILQIALGSFTDNYGLPIRRWG